MPVSIKTDRGGSISPYLHNIKRGKLNVEPGTVLIPSTHHWHVYEGAAVTWRALTHYLAELQADGWVQRGYVGASLARGFTLLRAPWEHKHDTDMET